MIVSDPLYGQMTVAVEVRNGKVELNLDELSPHGGDFSGLARLTGKETDELIIMLQRAKANL